MENIQFPNAVQMHKPESNKAEKLLVKLDELSRSDSGAGSQKLPEVPEETISDDFDLDENVRVGIERDEAVVRGVLELFDISYDDLVRMDGKSIYSRAVKANPAILENVKGAKSPVMEALKIALSFKPYAEFMEKYGDKPEDIKAAIRKEIESEKKQDKPQKTQEASTPFSQINGHGASHKKVRTGDRLEDIFNN